MERLFTLWWLMSFTAARRHVMDEIFVGGGWSDRCTRQAFEVLCPGFPVDDPPLRPSEPIPTDVPVPEPYDVPVPQPTDAPPPDPRDVPPPKPTGPRPRPVP